MADPMRQALEETAVAMINKIIDYMDDAGIKEISRETMIKLRDEFKSKCDLT